MGDDIFSDGNQVKILIEEYKVFREEILHKISAFQKNIYIFASITLILVGLGIQGDFDQIFVILPFVIATGHLLIIEDFRWLCRLAKYSQVIGEKINTLVDVDYKIVYWEQLVEDWLHESPLYQSVYNIVVYLPVMIIYTYSAHSGACFMDTYCHCDCIPMYNVFIFIYFVLVLFCAVPIYKIFITDKEILKTIKIKMNLQPQTTTQNKQ